MFTALAVAECQGFNAFDCFERQLAVASTPEKIQKIRDKIADLNNAKIYSPTLKGK